MTKLLSSSDLQLLDKNELLQIIGELQHEISMLRNQPETGLTPEESICISQLKYLNHIAQNTELTMEEAKKFDIFHKNLRLARGQVVEVKDDKKKKPQLSLTELMEIASAKD